MPLIPFFKGQTSYFLPGVLTTGKRVSEREPEPLSQTPATCKEEVLQITASHPKTVGPYGKPFSPSDPPFTWEMLEAAVRSQHPSTITYLLTTFPTATINDLIIQASLTHRSIPSSPSFLPMTALFSTTSSTPPPPRSPPPSEAQIQTSRSSSSPKAPTPTLAASPLEDIRRLVDRGAEVHRSSALQNAARAGRVDVVECLLDAGADVDDMATGGCGGDFDRTALHYAVEAGHMEVVRLLLERGADVYSRDEAGKTVLEKVKGRRNEMNY
ncbi:MAG: hypothetical protein M1830_005368 [Pleopsidium flavum]|nr:MAG: hypothetical protein M1830_005368 [Pleopsidium flavum]